MARNNKYSSYRGRRNGLKWVIAMVLIAVIAVSLGYFFWGDHTLSWSMFPRFAKEESVETQAVVPEVELIIDSAQPGENTTQRGGLLLSSDATTWADQDSTDFDMLALTMKDSNGVFYYTSQTDDLVWGATSNYAQSNDEYIAALLAQDIYTAAFVATLQDPLYGSYYVTASALMSDRGFGYKDGNSMVWLDPGKEDAMEWVTAVVSELVAMGFDEIVLTDFYYPQTGDLESIRYTADDPDQALTDLLVAIYTITQEAEVALGMEMGPLVSDSVPYEDWATYVDAFYTTANDADTATSLVGADKVVVMAEQVPTSGNYLLVP